MVGAISSGMGGIDASALKQMQEKMFKQADLNGDGKITKEEMNKVVQSEGTQKGPSVDEVFKNLDTDNDGAISKLESDAGLAKLAQQMQGKDGAQDKGLPPRAEMWREGGNPEPPKVLKAVPFRSLIHLQAAVKFMTKRTRTRTARFPLRRNRTMR